MPIWGAESSFFDGYFSEPKCGSDLAQPASRTMRQTAELALLNPVGEDLDQEAFS